MEKPELVSVSKQALAVAWVVLRRDVDALAWRLQDCSAQGEECRVCKSTRTLLVQSEAAMIVIGHALGHPATASPAR